LLKELLPRLSRVAVLWNAANPYSALVYKETQAGGRTLGIEVQSLDVRGPDDFDGTFEAARRAAWTPPPPALRMPTKYLFATCCARAASGHAAAAPPSSVMNWRRVIQ
jgi:hypothetical protein